MSSTLLKVTQHFSILASDGQYDRRGFSLQLLLCCFFVCLIATVNLIVANSNSIYAKDMAKLSIYDDNSLPGMINLDSIHADAISVERLDVVDTNLVLAQLNYEQRLADLAFALQQYQMMELQTFNFVIEVSEREQATTMMIKHLQTMLAEFTRLNPDINADWQIDTSNGAKLIVQLNTERERNWGEVGFII